MIALAVFRTAAQSSTVQGDLLTDWTSMKDTMTKIADALPEEKLGYKPTPAQRSYREQILHVAVDNVALMKLLGAKIPPPAAKLPPREVGGVSGSTLEIEHSLPRDNRLS